MKRIQEVGLEPRQQLRFTLDDGTSFEFELYYIFLQRGWFFTYIRYENFLIRNIRVCNSPNILNQFRNQIPFGIACVGDEGREPYFREDFFEGVNRLLVLNQDEIHQYGKLLSEPI